ncbi:hypothetical protein CSKR_102357 [Clonorchis sinensis]|uniref:C2HC/C3H-type domain-containing protein n=1 Tax=Clonorchis sinensis TaxID=79923 RepID=A0A8T1MWE5_CLOSI|nr:hypothetical protein CSKR_102357 [Clonorchis sinensis]
MELKTRLPCGSCSRQFFATSLPKHEAYCRKPRQTTVNKAGGDGTNVVKHTEDYQKISPFLSSMSDLLRLGKERRQRWLARHNEFQAILRHSRGEKMDFQDPAINAGIVITTIDKQTCEYCGRSFNEAAFRKHLVRCEEAHNRLWSNGANSPEHADAARRFKARMNYKPTIQRGNRTQVNARDFTEEIVYSSATSHPSNYPTPTSSVTLNELSMENYSGQTGALNMDVVKPVVKDLSWNAVEQLSNCNHLLVYDLTDRSQQAEKMKDRPDTSTANSGLEDSWDSNRFLTVLQDYTLKPTPAQDADSLPHYSSPSQTSSLSTVSLLKFSDNEPTRQDRSKTLASTMSLARCPWSPTVSSFAEGRFQTGRTCLVWTNGLLTQNLAKPTLSDAESQTTGKRDYLTPFTTHKNAEINISHLDVSKSSFIPTLPPEKSPSDAFPVACGEQNLTSAAPKASHSMTRKEPKETTEPTHAVELAGDLRPRLEGSKTTPAVPLYPVLKPPILKGARCVSEFSKTVPTPKRELRTQDQSDSNSEVNSRTHNSVLQTYLPGIPTALVLTKAMLHRPRQHGKTTSDPPIKSFLFSPDTLVDQIDGDIEEMKSSPEIAVTKHNHAQLSYCYECGARYVAETAKFCSHCGAVRPVSVFEDTKHLFRGQRRNSNEDSSVGLLNVMDPFDANCCPFQ